MALTEKVMVASQGLSPQREPQTDQTMAHSSPHIHPLTWLVTWRQRCKQIFACTPISHVYPDPCLSTHDPTCTPHTNTHPHPCLCTPLSTCVHISHAPACGSPEASLLGARGLDQGCRHPPKAAPCVPLAWAGAFPPLGCVCRAEAVPSDQRGPCGQ